MAAGLKVLYGEAPLSTLAQYGYHYSNRVPAVYDDMQGSEGADGSTDRYEPATAPSSTYRPRPEHMVNAAVSVDRGVMIRAGSGAGSLVSDDGPTCSPEHVSANKKASSPAQDLVHQAALGQLGVANCGDPTGTGVSRPPPRPRTHFPAASRRPTRRAHAGQKSICSQP